MGEEPLPLGTGKIFVCRADDLKKNPDTPMELPGEPVSMKPGMLTYEDDDLRPPFSSKGFTATGSCTIEGPAPELQEMLDGPRLVSVTMERKPGKLPRKMKKAYRSDYPRNTKWTRKVTNYIRRMMINIPQAEIVVTKEQRDRIAARLSQEIEISINPIKQQ